MKRSQLKLYITEIAQTISLHPANLGIENEESGKFYVEQNVAFNIGHCQNMSKVAQASKDLKADERVSKTCSDHEPQNGPASPLFYRRGVRNTTPCDENIEQEMLLG